MIDDHARRAWHTEFDPDDLLFLRSAIPEEIEGAQRRSALAHTVFADPDGEQFVYGAGMSRAVYKGLGGRLASRRSFHRETVAGTRHELMFIGHHLIFPIRIGKRMPRNISRVRIPYMPDQRREVLGAAGVHKFDPPTLFAATEVPESDELPTLDDARARLAIVPKESLIVPYYSSVPDGVGAIYWAPAHLAGGQYLDFIDPERLVFSRQPQAREAAQATASRVATFADGSRPRTPTKLRPKPKRPDGD